MYVSDEYSELGQKLKNGLVIDPPGFFKIPKLGAYDKCPSHVPLVAQKEMWLYLSGKLLEIIMHLE